jgi:hypothetical protein
MAELVATGKDVTVGAYLQKATSKWVRLYMNESVGLDEPALATKARSLLGVPNKHMAGRTPGRHRSDGVESARQQHAIS